MAGFTIEEDVHYPGNWWEVAFNGVDAGTIRFNGKAYTWTSPEGDGGVQPDRESATGELAQTALRKGRDVSNVRYVDHLR